MKLLVTGVTGFIGSHLVQRLVADGHSVHAVVRESSDPSRLAGATPYVMTGDISDLITFMKEQQFDGVFHLASLFLARHRAEDIRGLIDSNVLFSSLLLESAVQADIPWFINTGTFWQHYENEPYNPVNLYAATKQAFEDIARYYLETSPINFVTLKLSDTFGPGDTRQKLVNLWMKTAQNGEAMKMSPGEQIIDISYVENVVDAFVRLLELLSGSSGSEYRGRSFAVSSGEAVSLRETASRFEEATDLELKIEWGGFPYRPREVMVPWTLGEPVPGWTPKVGFQEGIKKTFKA